MSKVTSKYQISIPKSLADELRIKPGDEVEWTLAGNQLRLVGKRKPLSVDERLELVAAARTRQAERDTERGPVAQSKERGWTREELYDRGRTR